MVLDVLTFLPNISRTYLTCNALAFSVMLYEAPDHKVTLYHAHPFDVRDDTS